MTTDDEREPVSNVWGTPPPPGSTTLKVTPSYGGAWQEFRAWLALSLIGWAQAIHFRATLDMADDIAELHARQERLRLPLEAQTRPAPRPGGNVQDGWG